MNARNPIAAALPEIPRARYTDEAFYRAEIEQVFRKSWLMVGHVSDFGPGVTSRQVDLPFAPLLLTRAPDGELRAFLNACAHRGAAVLRADEGRGKLLTCPYHGWTYNLTGQLIGVPSERNFPCLDRSHHGLEPVRCELWGGFVFINLNPQAPPLREALAPLVNLYSPLMEAPMRLVSREVFEFPCNWKIVAEAFREAYHIDCVHRGTVASMVKAPDTYFEFYPGGYDTVLSPYNEIFLQSSIAGMDEAKGYRTDLPDHPLMVRQDFKQNLVAINFFPDFTFGTLQNGFGHISALPLSVNRTRVEVKVYGMDWGAGVRPSEWDDVVTHFVGVVREDLANLSSIQRSVEASSARSVVLSTVMERALYELHVEIDRCIGSNHVPAALRIPEVPREFHAHPSQQE